MKPVFFRLPLFLLMLTLLSISSYGSGDSLTGKPDTLAGKAVTDSLKKIEKQKLLLTPYHKNVLKFNPTPMLVLGEVRNITLNYERMLNKNQSASIQVGYLLFPKLFSDTIARLLSLTSREKTGVNIALDYRYYPFARNRRPAPDGLYIGGYVSYYGFHFRNNFDLVGMSADQNGKMDGKFNFLNLGMELGYQFVLWKRFTIDMLMFGPSLSYYQGNFVITGDLDEENISAIDQELVDKLFEKIPILRTIFSEDKLEFTGSRSSISIGFRYSLMLGFHF